MSRLQELLDELCPDGVEYKTIGELATDIYRGSGIKRDEVTDDGIPCVRYGEIYTTYNIWFDECVSHTKEDVIASPKYFEHGDILFAITGESVEDIAKSCAYVGHDRCMAGGDIVVLKHNQNPKYLAYALSTNDACQQKSKGKVKSKVVHSSVPAIKGIRLPVPPLEVQCEIVRVLDSFTLLTDELTDELTARKKQYEYYKHKLFNESNEVQYIKIGEFTNVFSASRVHKDEWTESGVPFWRSSDLISYFNGVENSRGKAYISYELYEKLSSKSGKICKDDILITGGGTIGIPYIVPSDEPMYVKDADLLCIQKNDTVITKYLYYYFLSEEFRNYLKSITHDATIAHYTITQIKDTPVPVPSIQRQQLIVDILDKFEVYTKDISKGLPAEIEARKKQYEYYRDKLLSFKELEKAE